MTDQKLDLQPIKEEVDTILYEHQEVIIETQDDYTKAGDVAKLAQRKIKLIEEKRKQYTQPIDEAKKRIMDDFRKLTDPLEEFVEVVKEKMRLFYIADKKKRDDEQAKIDVEALEKAKKEDLDSVSVPVVNDVKTQRGNVATTTAKKIIKWEIIDENLVPREFLSVDKKKVDDYVSRGKRHLEGIRIYEDVSISLR